MTRLALPLSLAALAVVAACATKDPVTPAPAPIIVTPAPAVMTAPPAMVVVPPAAVTTAPVVVPTPTAIRPGFGRIESITPIPPTAAAGGTTHRRLGIKMDDGTVQYVDTPATGYAIGDRIELTSDGHIRR